jgi:SHO1 osmosensor
MNHYDGGYGGGRKKFSLGNIFGDPFPLATLGIGIVRHLAKPVDFLCLVPNSWHLTSQSGWMIAFVSSIIADVQGDYPNYCWWSLAFMLLCIVSVFVTVAMDSVHTYRVALVGLFSAGLVFTTSSVNSLIYYSDAAKEAAAAGFILLSMVSVCQCSQSFQSCTS